MDRVEEDRATLRKMGVMFLSYMLIVGLLAAAVIVLT